MTRPARRLPLDIAGHGANFAFLIASIAVATTIEFFFDCVSPASYLAWTQMPALARDTGAPIEYRPMFLPGLFKLAGSSSPIGIPAKGKWMFDDLNRFAARYRVPFRPNRKFPLNSITMMRGLEAWRGEPEFMTLGDAFMDAMWVSDRDVTDPQILGEIVAGTGVDPARFSAAVQDPAVKQRLIAATGEAHERGAFGAPTFFVGQSMFWGQDRLDFVREAVGATP